ncbi:hypothetical protein, conserved, containing ATP/GTP-binding site motif A [Thermococcus kodakarensis KOD1]|uniref:Uncharacterized protein n=1 Tax=Thermococcus kodakarensis (strain ATCC BAA-918 / JCM 12380 / KOD1) TaxID=69014 RepID=Q5JE23_THEKO|nr:hypothetical protein [Thermococcus kodakarensis]WCN29278.1 hypothetical protein POG15_05530 [Thermococcus kodakarensis]WCN31574.1 hypothetical protein POG21_05530 [Thermococcus kodakarensis]BAD85281.1 hypothetical protein, conserved, containing ATP/GTP-binding site motif A [Thermococcus kodakarensis KOD1]
MISVGGVGVLFEGELDDGFEDGFRTTFARRYLPDVLRGDARPNVIIERFKGEKFRVFSSLYDVNSKDYYKLESAVPQAYKNEAPVFFLLQATARAGARKGRIFITDSVSVINENGKAVLFVGYPHTGKSTISALALSEGLPLLSTENTVVDVRDGRIFVIGGTDVLVYDPKIEEIYGIKVEYQDTTRSGYRIVDISSSERRIALRRGVEIEKIIVLHAAFGGGDASFSPVRGRKIKKTLWYFSTSLLKGMDYYEPAPLYMPMSDEINSNLNRLLDLAVESYSGAMFEAFGNHRDVFRRTLLFY